MMLRSRILNKLIAGLMTLTVLSSVTVPVYAERQSRINDDNLYFTENDLNQINNDLNRTRPYSDSSIMYRNWTSQSMSNVLLIHSINILTALTEGYLEKFKPEIDELIMEGWKYDIDKTKRTYYHCKHPYTKMAPDGHWYNMGDFIKTCTGTTATEIEYGDESGWEINLGGDGKHVTKVVNRHIWSTYNDRAYDRDEYRRIPEMELNNDLNFSEVAVILSQGDFFNTDTQKYRDYKNNLMNERNNDKYFYEMKAEGPFFYITYDLIFPGAGENGEDLIEHHNTEEDHGETKHKDECLSWVPAEASNVQQFFYYKLTIKPWGLRELYRIAGFDFVDDDEQPGDDQCNNNVFLKNYQFLDMSERTDRVYNRIDFTSGEMDYLGPSCLEYRDYTSPIIGEGKTYKKKAITIYIGNDGKGVNTGRSANWYIKKKDLINLEDFSSEDNISTDPEYDDDGVEGIPDMSVQEFLKELKSYIINDMKTSGILASLTAAQAILESKHGCSGLAKKGKNLFGIKGTYNGQSVNMLTTEYYNGVKQRVMADFRKYPSWAESISDHSALFNRADRYVKLRGCTDWKLATKYVREAGYATSPTYTSSLRSVIKTYKLYEWDEEVLGR